MTGASLQDAIGAAAALAVGGVMAWAGVAKLRTPAATTASFRSLGIPFAAAWSRVVPAVELGVFVLCVVLPRVGASAAAVLLTLFTVLLGVHVGRGSMVSCGCFGSADPAPVTWITLVRNGALIVIAVSAASMTPAGLATFRTADALAALVSALCITAGGALLLGLLSMKQSVGAVFSQAPRKSPSTLAPPSAVSPTGIQPV